MILTVVLDTTKVQIFKQITTTTYRLLPYQKLFQIPQKYRFSSKSQQAIILTVLFLSCFRYHKSTDFQANHNTLRFLYSHLNVVLDTTKVQIFKQITTLYRSKRLPLKLFQIPQKYRFSSKSQLSSNSRQSDFVVLDTTKVQIFKQITTHITPRKSIKRCFRYHKSTDFQANHNSFWILVFRLCVVLDTTKVQIFKQITTAVAMGACRPLVVLDTTKVQIFKQITTDYVRTNKRVQLFQIPQKYRFSSKSQQPTTTSDTSSSCFRYHKSTDFQANHNVIDVDITLLSLFQIPQKYRFSSKSQLKLSVQMIFRCCFRYHKSTDFQANHNPNKAYNEHTGVVLDTTKVQIFKQITTPC